MSPGRTDQRFYHFEIAKDKVEPRSPSQPLRNSAAQEDMEVEMKMGMEMEGLMAG